MKMEFSDAENTDIITLSNKELRALVEKYLREKARYPSKNWLLKLELENDSEVPLIQQEGQNETCFRN